MEKLDCPIWYTSPAVGETLEEMKKKINELVDEVNNLKDELSRVHKDRPNPQNVNPYKPRKRY